MDRELRILLAEREIAGVINAYCHAMDFNRRDDFLACFTPDALFEVLLPNGDTYVSVRGADELARFMGGFEGRPGVHKHVYVTPLFQVDPEAEEAMVSSTFLMVSAEQGSVGVSSFGRTTDRFVRSDGRWRIKERHLVTEAMNVPAPAEAP